MSEPFSALSTLDLVCCRTACFPSAFSQRYIERLDLKPAGELLSRFESIWPGYPEAVRNRAFGVRLLADQCLQEVGGPRQVVIAGAGAAPLGIELKAAYPFLLVLEVDEAGMPHKEHLVAALGDTSLADIRFVEAGLEHTDLVRQKLLVDGLDPVEDTLLIAEGVSGSLTREALKALVDIVRLPGLQSRVILDLVAREEAVAPLRREVAGRLLGLLADAGGRAQVERYGAEEIASWPWTKVLERYSLSDLETLRTGASEFFPTRDSGWTEVCLLAV